MKNIYLLFRVVTTSLMVLILLGCNMDKVNTDENSKLRQPCINWSFNKDQVKDISEGELIFENDNMLVFRDVDSLLISHTFKREYLQATVMFVPEELLTKEELSKNFNTYENIAEQEYYNSSIYTYGRISQIDEDRRIYYCIGWCDVRSHRYEVGDLYPTAESPIGVIWCVTDDGRHGSILSLSQQSSIQWDYNGIFCTDYNCDHMYDGTKNKLPYNQPYGKWVHSLGSGWYGPSRGELVNLNSSLTAVNKTLVEQGFGKVQGFYWSSSEYSNNHAYVVTVSESEYMGCSPKKFFYHNKDQKNSACAMKNF